MCSHSCSRSICSKNKMRCKKMSIFKSDKNELVYLGEETRTSEKGNEFTLVHIGNTVEMQRHSFFKDADCNTTGLVAHDPVQVTLNIDTMGYNLRTTLRDIKKIG